MAIRAYTSSQKSLHWLVFVVVLGVYLLTYVKDLFPRDDPMRAVVWLLHRSFGMLLLALVIWRLALRSMHVSPELPRSMTALQKTMAKLMHVALYILLITIIMLGVVMTWYRGDVLSFFGIFTIPSPVIVNVDIGHLIKDVHGLLANVLLAMVGLHAGAALWHHYWRKDDVLTRMMPEKSQAPVQNGHLMKNHRKPE